METFHSIIGHRRVIDYLQESIRAGRVSHAYILDGPEGIGKMLTARVFAATLLCREGGEEPCGSCISCMQMEGGNQPDVSYVTHEKTVITVGDIREQLCNVVPVKPMVGPYRIFIVDEAEKMNEEAQNALLKTLEEPPSYAVIILLTTTANELLPTIRSRSVELPMLPVPEKELTEWLMAREQLPDYRARMLAVYSGGCPGVAMACARSEEFQSQRDKVVSMLKAVPSMREDRMAEFARDFSKDKEKQEAELSLILVWIRDLLMYKAVGEKAGLMFVEESDAIRDQAEAIGYDALWATQEEIGRIRADRAVNVNMETAFWLFLLRWQERFEGYGR